MMRKAPAIAVAALLALALMAGPSGAETVRVRAFGETTADFHWHPAKRRIAPGDKVTWLNTTPAVHTVTSYGGNWKKNTNIAPDARTSFTFSKTGLYKYRCTKHSKIAGGKCSGMCGTVRVVN